MISHGIPGLNFSVNSSVKSAGIGNLIVNSEYEKEKYSSLGWQIEKIHVLGTPRFDKLFAQTRQTSKPSAAETKKILFCPHFIGRRNEKIFTGALEWSGKYITELNTRTLIEAAKNESWTLWIKPHSDEGTKWSQFLSRFDRTNIFLWPFNKDINQLIAECNVLVATYSTVVIEGCLAGKPVISLNLTGCEDKHPYAEHGLVTTVKDANELHNSLKEVLKQDQYSLNKMAYFLGPRSGKNTETVMNWIACQLN